MNNLPSLRTFLFVFLLATIVEVEYFSELVLYDELPALAPISFLLCFLSFAIQDFIQFSLIYILNIKVIHFLDSRYSWDQSFLRRSILEFISTSTIACSVTIPFVYFLDYGVLVPYWKFPSDGLAITLYYNLLYIMVLNALFVVSYEVFHLYVQRKQIQLNMERAMRKNILTQFEALRYQVHPHFLFNSLDSLRNLIKTDPKLALSFTENFTRIYRDVLSTADSPTISIEKELQFVKSFIFLQQIRFANSLEVHYAVESDGQVPPFAIQSLVENAIKHNTLSASQPLIISIKQKDNCIEVVNNLNTRSEVISTGIGLSNLKDRYKLITSETPVFHNNGTHFVATIPILTM